MLAELWDGLPAVLRAVERRGDLEALGSELAKIKADGKTLENMVKLSKVIAETAIQWATDYMPDEKGT
ncbi:MAG: hypothetical protein HYX94_01025 [Chloroflexi bacterium]|nr:hypothetical protein [Chloroflexota bacterium]